MKERSREPLQLEHIKLLEEWMKSYKPEELFDENGRLIEELAELAPKGDRRMGVNPHANGGLLLKDLKLPNFCDRPLAGIVGSTNNYELPIVNTVF